MSQGMVQIDKLFVNLRPDRPLKHFTAYDPVAEWTLGHVAADATASAAKTLLDKLISTAPFEVKGIQVDGGSELMSVFEVSGGPGRYMGSSKRLRSSCTGRDHRVPGTPLTSTFTIGFYRGLVSTL